MKYILIVLVAISLFTFLMVNGREVEIEIEPPEQIEIERTLDSEIDRLSIKYHIASSTARAIIYCESRMYGSAVNHNRLKDGTIWSTDMYHFQINDYYHKDTMTRLGLDYYDQWDSLEYGFILLKDQGLTPWKASKGCWSSRI
jgi:hypothetical protein